MAKSRTIRVTPNLKYCHDELKKLIKSLPSGEKKKKAEAAIGYISRTFAGKKQFLKGYACPVGKDVMPS